VGQYHAGKWFWPEIESNATFYHGGANDGRVQNFVTPGLMLSKFKLEHDERNRLALVFGGGMQIVDAISHLQPRSRADNAHVVLIGRRRKAGALRPPRLRH
jgi:hypothetical protein